LGSAGQKVAKEDSSKFDQPQKETEVDESMKAIPDMIKQDLKNLKQLKSELPQSGPKLEVVKDEIKLEKTLLKSAKQNLRAASR
jgi:hypothetical protein